MKNDLEHRLLMAAGQHPGGHAGVAKDMGSDAAQLSRIFSHQQGVPLDKLERFLAACGMQVIPLDCVVMDRKAWDEHNADYEAMRRLASRAINHDQTLTLPAQLVAVK